MRKAGSWLIPAVALLLIGGPACSIGEKSKELLALDNAYKAGVLTKDEYDAKKAALSAVAATRAALDKAFEAGVLNKDEYTARKARLDAKVNSLAALEKAYSAGVVTKDEYLAKKAALLATDTPVPVAQPAQGRLTQAEPPPENSSPGAATNDATNDAGHSYRMKMVKVMDASGFERPMVSASLLVPTDWQSQGATTWNIKDGCNTVQTAIRTSGPDGRGFDVFPAYNWVWADDPKFLQQSFAQKAQMGTHACDVIPPMSASDYLRRNLAKFRPNAQLAGIEPAPKLMETLQQQAHQAEQSAAQYHLQQRVRPDAVRARLKYTLDGHPVEEWLTVVTIVTGTLGPSYNVATMRQTQAFSYSCVARAFGERAPQGQLEASEKLFDLIGSTFRVDPEWQSRIAQNALAVQQIELKGIRDRSAIVAKNADDIRNIQRQGFENRQKTQDQAAAEFSQVIRGVESYRDPTSGQTVELSSQYGHAWVNNRGEYLLSDQPNLNPSVTLKEDWRPLEHVKPQ